MKVKFKIFFFLIFIRILSGFLKVVNQVVDNTLRIYRTHFNENPNNIQQLADAFCKCIKTPNNSVDVIFNKVKKINDLLRTLSKSLSKNWKLILKLIELVLIFCEACRIVRPHVHSHVTHPMMMMMHNFGLDYSNDENEDFSNLTNTILNWHRKECFEDILLTFGLKERSGEDLQAFAKQE
jgi:hypothetical protein